MPTLTIRLDDELERKLTRLAKETGHSKSEIARDAVWRRVHIERFSELRQLAIPYAAAAGYRVDDELLRDDT